MQPTSTSSWQMRSNAETSLSWSVTISVSGRWIARRTCVACAQFDVDDRIA